MPMIEWWCESDPDYEGLLAVQYVSEEGERRDTYLHVSDIDRVIALLERWGWERTYFNSMAKGPLWDSFINVHGDPDDPDW